jgi:hypothetical protein
MLTTTGDKNMNRGKLRIIVPVLCSLLATGWLKQEKIDPEVRLSLELADGSRVIGVPRIDSVPIHTTYGEIDIPLSKLLKIRMGKDHESAFFYTVTRDKITGVMRLEKIRLRTLFGKISVGTEHVKSMAVLGRLSTNTEGGFPVLASAKITDRPYSEFCVADFNGDMEMDFAVSDQTRGSESVDVYLKHDHTGKVLVLTKPMPAPRSSWTRPPQSYALPNCLPAFCGKY